jgi:hypothetical protein
MSPAELAKVLSVKLGEAGVPIHNCAGIGRSVGGCCLVPMDGDNNYPGGVVAAWTCADTLRDGGACGERWLLDQVELESMTAALWEVLEAFGFAAVAFGQLGLPLVTGVGRFETPLLDLGQSVLPCDPNRGRKPAHGGDANGREGQLCPCCGRGRTSAYVHSSEASTACETDGRVPTSFDEQPPGDGTQLLRCDDEESRT